MDRIELESRLVDREVIAAAFGGDGVAMNVVVCCILKPIKAEVGRCVRQQALLRRRDHRDHVDDFSQGVIIHLIERDGRLLRQWDPARGQCLSSFVRMIARQWVSRTLQGDRRNPWRDDPTEHEALEPLLEQDGPRILEAREELRVLLHRLKTRLNDRGLILFRRIYIEQQPIREVASGLGMTRAAVDAWKARVRRLAKSMYGNETGSES